MNTFENQSVTTSNSNSMVKFVLILISALAGVIIYVLLYESYIRGGDKMLNYAAGILLAEVLVSFTMWPSKTSS
jgi:hypothetical protein